MSRVSGERRAAGGPLCGRAVYDFFPSGFKALRKALCILKGDIVMNASAFGLLEDFMLSCMGDSAHDAAHVYRVLFNVRKLPRAKALSMGMC